MEQNPIRKLIADMLRDARATLEYGKIFVPHGMTYVQARNNLARGKASQALLDYGVTWPVE